MAVTIPLARYLQIQSASDPSFSPDGRFVSFLSNTTGVNQLWQVPVEGGWPTQLTYQSERIQSASYNPVQPEILFGIDSGGNERTQLHRLFSLERSEHGLGDGWTTEDLTRYPRAVHNFGGWSHDGQWITFSANRANPSRFDLYIQKIGAQEAKLLRKGPGGYYTSVGWSPDDKYLLVIHTESNFNQNLFLVEVATGEVKALTAHKGEVQYHHPHWAADGKSIYCTSTAQGRDLAGLARIDRDSGKLTYLETPDHEVESVLPSPKGRWLAWRVNLDGKSQLFLRDLRAMKLVPTPKMPLGVIGGMTFARDDSRLAFVLSGPRHNSNVWLWDLAPAKGEEKKTAAVRQLTRAGTAGVPLDRFVVPELIHYPTFDKRQIPAWFYLPPEEARPSEGRLPPVIVYPHGGPESQYRPTFNALFQFFLQSGYAILAPNVRGSAGYGTTYLNLDNTTKRMDAVADLAYAAHWLRDQKKGDPKRLAVFGGSYGGFMVLASVTHYPELWAAGVDVVGICNFVTFLEKTGDYRRAHRSAEYGNLEEHRAFFEKISPIHHVDKIRCPIMVIHGANDPRVPIGEAEQIVAALKKRSIPVDYLRYEDEGHGLARLKNRLDAYPKMVAFLNKYLK